MSINTNNDGKILLNTRERVHRDKGNFPLIDLLGNGGTRILDISECDVFGITYSAAEAEMAKTLMKQRFGY